MSRRASLIAAAVLAAIGAALLAAALLGDGDADREALRREVEVDVTGASLVEAEWRDEEHVRYVDTGGYDQRAGWALSYSIDQPFAVAHLLDVYEEALVERGWSVVHREDDDCSLRLEDGPEDAARTVNVDCVIDRELESQVGPDDSPLSTTSEATTREFEVRVLLPFEEEPRYPG